VKTGATIVIPTFNRKNFLREAIESALGQTCAAEVIVVDHGSTDGTPEVAGEFGESIVYIRREIDSGPVFSWLDGVLAAKSELVKLLYDDDVLEESFLETTIPLITPEVGFVFTRAAIIDENGQFVGQTLKDVAPSAGTFAGYRSRSRIRHKVISPSAILLRKRDLIDGLYCGRLPFQKTEYHGAGADNFVKHLCLLRYPKFASVDRPLVRFRSHPGSITIKAGSQADTDKRLSQVYEHVETFAEILETVKALHLVQALERLNPVRRGSRRLVRRLVRRPKAFLLRYGRQLRYAGIIPVRIQKLMRPLDGKNGS
jgi:glycosyltransferase involved in cell wall biosynthesis